jgi:hypothetical protein
MLVDVQISQWTARKVDKIKSVELTENHKASAASALVSKKLMQVGLLKEISTLITQARDYNKKHTSPWLQDGTRILSAASFIPHRDGMEALEAQFQPLVDRFIERYPQFIHDMGTEHLALGLLWDRNDYPSVSAIKRKFAWSVRYFSLPDAADFRVDIGQSQVDAIRSQITSSVELAAKNAVQDVIERAHEAVARMVESLTAFDPAKSGKARGTFRDTMVENIRELVAIMPGLNFTNDARIDQLTRDLASLTQFDAEDLRSSDNIRAGVLKQAMDIADSVSDFMA